MRVFCDLSGTGTGAKKQYNLLRRAKPGLFTTSESQATHIIYFQSYTTDWRRLAQRKRARRKIICRVGGFHTENAEITWKLLREADGAIFVAEWLKGYLKTPRLLGKTWKLPAKRTVIRNGSTWIGRRDSDVDYLLIRCANIGRIQFKRGLNRAYSIWAMGEIWEEVRKQYPKLELWILGNYEQGTKDEYILPGWKWLGYKGNARWYGQGALGLVHLVPDFSPNTVAEILSEGAPAIVPNVGGASELAGYGGVHVRFERTDKRKFPEVECGGRFYRIDLDSLMEAVRNVAENRQVRQLAVADWWKKYVDIRLVVKQYERFLKGVR